MPRIKPVIRYEAPQSIELLFKQMDALGKPPPNAHLTYARSPALYEKWFPFATYLMPNSIIAPRDRQLLILRTAFIWRSTYLWAQHADISLRLSLLTPEDLSHLAEDELTGWRRRERAVLEACDETKSDGVISAKCWSVLEEFLGGEELVELTFLIGQYILIATTVRSLGVELDDGMKLPAWATRAG